MGVVQRQSIKQSIVTWAGMVIGALNLFYFYPKTLNNEQIGILQFVIRAATFFLPFALLGSHIVAVRYFPFFAAINEKRGGFLGILLLISSCTTAILSFLIWGFQDVTAQYFANRSSYFLAYLPYILPLIWLSSFSYLLVIYATNYQRIVIPALFWNLLSKCTLPLLCLGFAAGYWGFNRIFEGLFWTYTAVLVGLVGYTVQQKHWDIQLKRAPIAPFQRKEMWQFYGFSSLFGVSFTVLNQVDAILVGTLLNLSSVAIYSVGFFLAEAIDTPRKALLSISGPLIAKDLANNNKLGVAELYKKVSINQLIAGGWLLLGIWYCADPLFAIMPRGAEFKTAKTIILILGLGRLFDMAGSLNYEIINYSKAYKWLLPLTILAALSTVVLDLTLIPSYGLVGVALATSCSVLLYNFAKCWFIWRQFGCQPLSIGTLSWAVILVVLLVVAPHIPHFSSPYVDLVARGIWISILYFIGVWALRCSFDFNALLQSFFDKIKRGV